MARKKHKNKRDAGWAEAKRRCRLSADDVRMAKELGLKPRSLIKNIPSKSQPWKAPVRVWIGEMYEKRQRKAAKKKARSPKPSDRPPASDRPRKEHGASRGVKHLVAERDTVSGEPYFVDAEAGVVVPVESEEFQAWFEAEHEAPGIWGDGGAEGGSPRRPSQAEIQSEDRAMLRRQERLRLAAEYVAAAFAQVPAVQKVVLFGSVAAPLQKEVPRFREFRRAGVEIWHECRDVDLAAWVTDLGCLRALQRTRGRALNDLLRDRDLGVAHHQVDVFVLEAGTGRYLGRLCIFSQCPKDKEQCLVPGCGTPRLLQQHESLTFDPADAIAPDKSVVLYDRSAPAGQEVDNTPPF